MQWLDPAQWIDWIKAALIPLSVIIAGTLYRLYNDNARRCITVKQVLAEAPGVIFILLVARGIAEHYDLGSDARLALMAVLAWVGPRVLVELVRSGASALGRYGSKKP